ncbi:hypothetical protein [Hymenobacter cellulosilyticus]|uniref:Uncharacterized protein n=1 Tax=Hymenobacter cellulosilyticus TaxID=2932248 RepID=A0A8T9Q1C0_9BACT|nr:hypothetical protein [Hymenobacter cellulosilyticus]UOQ70692.1 hypothetical protein MUN79_18575 [Hymenobacter cellulosilyticus]
MKSSFFRLRAGVFLLLLLSFTCTAAAQSKEQLVVPLSAPGKPGLLSVKLVNGSISVVGYGGKDVVVDVSSPGRRQDEDDRNEDDKESTKGLRRISPTRALT